MKWLVRVLAAIGLVVTAVSVTPFDFWLATRLAGRWDDPGGDTLIVLGGSMEKGGILAGDSYRRATYAALGWREGRFRRILVCGAHVAPPMREYMVFLGVPRGVIAIEDGSTSTRENALGARKALDGDAGSKVLLTSDYHMFRARRAFEKAGVQVLPRPIPDVRQRSLRWTQRWSAFLSLAEEVGKIAGYWWKEWI